MACKRYEEGHQGFYTIAKSVGCNYKTLSRWYGKYAIHGASAFETVNRCKSYSSEFKLSIVTSYLDGDFSLDDLCAKNNISNSVVREWVNKYNSNKELQDYNPRGAIHTMKKTRKTTFEERLEIAEWVVKNNLNYREAAETYKIPYDRICQWTKKYLSEGNESLHYKKCGRKPKNSINKNSLSEIENLKLELEKEKTLRKKREFEIEVLKKKEEFEKKNLCQK